MDVFLSWLGWAVGTLVLVALVVAGWEHLVREAQACDRDSDRNRNRLASQRAEDAHQALHSLPSLPIDVRLDTQAAAFDATPAKTAPLPAQPNPESDSGARVSAMTRVLSRATVGGLRKPERNEWLDTTPRVIGLDDPVSREQEQAHEREQEQEQSRSSSRSG